MAMPAAISVLPRYRGLRVCAYGPPVASTRVFSMCPEAQMRMASPRSTRTRPATSDQGRGRASAITMAHGTHPSGTRSLDGNAERGARARAQPAVDRLQDLFRRDRVHHAFVHGAAAAMTRRAERAAADGDVGGRPRTIARGVGGPEDSDHRGPGRAGEMQGTGVRGPPEARPPRHLPQPAPRRRTPPPPPPPP